MNKRTLVAAGLAAGTFALLVAPEVRADSLVINDPNRHPQYRVELEPKLDVQFFHGNNFGGRFYGGGPGYLEFGAGFRASIEIVDPGFIPRINNTVAITFGIDVTNCNNYDGLCYNDNRDYNSFGFWSPIGLQWNFFLTEKWSVFAEAGAMLHTAGFFADVYPDLNVAVGGRFHFNDHVALTLRAGYPFVSAGISFFVGG